MTSSNGNIFRVTGPLCGEFTGPGEFPTQRPVTRSFDVFFDLRLDKRLNKQSWGWWFETLSCPFWRHRNVGSQLSRPITYICKPTHHLLDFIVACRLFDTKFHLCWPIDLTGTQTIKSTKIWNYIFYKKNIFFSPILPGNQPGRIWVNQLKGTR